MTVTEALATAQSRVKIVSQGQQYVLHTWSPKHNATFVSPWSGDLRRAQCAAYETKIRVALELLGIPEIEQPLPEYYPAYTGERREDWRSVVRRTYRWYKLNKEAKHSDLCEKGGYCPLCGTPP